VEGTNTFFKGQLEIRGKSLIRLSKGPGRQLHWSVYGNPGMQVCLMPACDRERGWRKEAGFSVLLVSLGSHS
jgi:hypothetical protein